MVWRIGAPKRSWHPDRRDVFYFLCALLAILKPALKKRLCPQNSKQKNLEKCHPIRSHRELHVRSCHSGKDVCCGFNPHASGQKLLPWRNQRGNISPEISSLSEDRMPKGVRANLLWLWTHSKETGCPLKRQRKPNQSKTVWRRPGGNLSH